MVRRLLSPFNFPNLSVSFSRYTASLELHRSVMSLEFLEHISDSELQFIYNVASPARPTVRKRVTVTLVYSPLKGSGGKLADAQVEVDGEAESALNGVLDEHLRANDVRGLMSAVLARVRAEI
jgi:hypothetical protein